MHRSILSRCSTVALAAIVISLTSAAALGVQAEVDFSGGSGSPLTITLPQPITFTVTNANAGMPSNLEFDFQNVGSPFFGGLGLITGTLSYTVNGGPSTTLNRVTPTGTHNDISVHDITLLTFVDPNRVNLNDVVVLSSGSATTGFAYNFARPPSGAYSTIITNGIGTDLTATPEPGSLLSLLVLSPTLALRRRRRRSSIRIGNDKGMKR